MRQEFYYKFQNFCITHGLILDTNMLILYIVGETNKDEIPHNNLTKRYSPELYMLIRDLVKISKFKVPIITPHIVSETSHHLKLDSNRIKKGRDITFSPWFNKSIDVLQDSREEHILTSEIIKSRRDLLKELAHYGIPDLSIVDLSLQKNYAVITDDDELCDHMYRKGQKIMSAAVLNAVILNQNR